MTMKDYEANNLKNVLLYIKENYGLDVFGEPNRLSALFSDLAPSLKTEKRMLDLLSRLGILEDLLMCRYKEDTEQYHAVKIALTRLVDDEYIQKEIATKYLKVLAEVIEIKAPNDITINVAKDDNTASGSLDSLEISNTNVYLPETIAKLPTKVSCNQLKNGIDYLSYFYKKISVCINKLIRTVKVPILIILGFSGIILGYLSILFAFNKFMTWLTTITPASSGFFKSLIAIILMVLGFIPQLIINIPFSIINLLYYLVTGDWLSAPGLDGYSGFFF